MTPGAGIDVPIPFSHRDLLERPIVGVLTTLMADGRPRSSLVWLDHDGDCARINTTRRRHKARDMAADARVSLLVVDPEDTTRFIQIRGRVELIETGAVEHFDALARIYTGRGRPGGEAPCGEPGDVRVIGRIHARRISLDAIHR